MNKKKIFKFISFFSFIPITSVIIFSCVNNKNDNYLNNNIKELNQTRISETYITNGIITKGDEKDPNTLDKQVAGDIFLAKKKYPNDQSKLFYSSVWKNFIYNSILQNKPSGLKADGVLDIEYSSYNNLTGELYISKVKVENWLNSTGGLEESWKWIEPEEPVVVKGFKKILSTEVASECEVDDANLTSKIPTSVTLDEVKNFIYSKKDQIILNFPGTLSNSDINVLNIYPFNAEGTIICNIGLSKYYDKSIGELKTWDQNKVFGRVLLKGFKINNLGTSIKNPSVSIEGFRDVLAQEFCKEGNIPPLDYQNKIKNFIASNALSNLPDGFNSNNIKEIKYDSFNNLTGELQINQIVLDYYKDQDGNIKNDGTKAFDTLIIITGFKKVSPSIFNTSIKISDPYLNVGVDSITNDQLRQWVNENKNEIVVNGSEKLQLSFSNESIVRDSKKGTIKIDKISAQYWYKEENGELVYNMPNTWVLEITGFKQLDFATSIKTTDTSVKSDSILSSLASSEITYDNVNLKSFVLNNLIINPKNISYSINDIELALGVAQPLRGMLQITSITLPRYSDDNGNIVYKSKTFQGSFNLIDFKIISQTNIKTTVDVSNSNIGQRSIYKISDSEIDSYVKENLVSLFASNLPILTNEDILVNDIKRNSNNDTISLKISLNRYYNQNGQIIVVTSQNGNTPLSQIVTLTGFKPTTNETVIKENTSVFINQEKIPSIMYPGKITDGNPIKITKNDTNSLLLFNFIKDNCLVNIPANFDPLYDISYVSISNINNKDGSITINEISLKKYKNEDGNDIENQSGQPFSCNLNIYGFGQVNNYTKFQEKIPVSNFNKYISNIANASNDQIRDALYAYIKDYTLVSGQTPESGKDYIIWYLPSKEQTGIDYLSILNNYLNISDIKLKTNGIDSYVEFKLILGVYFDENYNFHASKDPIIGNSNIMVSELVSIGNPNLENEVYVDSTKDFFTKNNWRNTWIVAGVGGGVLLIIIILIIVAMAVLNNRKKIELQVKTSRVNNMVEYHNQNNNQHNQIATRNNNINTPIYNDRNRSNMDQRQNPNQRNTNGSRNRIPPNNRR